MATIYDWVKKDRVPKRLDPTGQIGIKINLQDKRACLDVMRTSRSGEAKTLQVILSEDEIAFLHKRLRFVVLPPEPPPVWVIRGGKTVKTGDYLANLNAPTIMTPLQSEARRFASASFAREVSGTGRVVKLTPRAPSVINSEHFSPLDPETQEEWVSTTETRQETKTHPAVERRSIRININDTVTVRLTPAGVDLLNRDRAGRFATSIRHRAVAPGPYTMTLWEFSVVFGPQLSMGGMGMIEKNALVLSTQRLCGRGA